MRLRQFQYRSHRRQRGFMILLAAFLVALVAISMAVAIPAITAQIRHDKEVEMIHRGVQYTRALQKFSAKNGNASPQSIDQLLETNHIRYLRQRYKDPITGKDFRLLRQSDPDVMKVLASIGAAGMTGPMGAAGSSLSQQAMMLAMQQNNGGVPGAKNVEDMANSDTSSIPDQQGQPSASPSPGSSSPFSSGQSGGSPFGGSTFGSSTPGGTASGSSSSGSSTLGGQTFGGGPFIGVASVSKKKGFHIFNKKEHYNEWLFIYTPALYQQGYPLGYLIKTPFNGLLNLPQNSIPGATPLGQPGASPAPTPGGGFGNSGNGFGGNSGSGFGGGSGGGFGSGGFGGNQTAPNPQSPPQQ
jgi:hypothetical protein